ncbi:uncharacterized protein LOC130644980 [Hydractinia symbiolongicarpus]|uniref:uncharacterized protein LOC130644980 n=1 Tax=Hydractinia symbiolongicarpus TaxID=13093 RepID=UPI00254CD45D|nr:uncharacterized protein LOC130644980 [Hydractinia symbiolongicarpus]XP_057306785.1 uncharacterized protein LOC130644980 [Hydractinia symbiolongicarpus]
MSPINLTERESIYKEMDNLRMERNSLQIKLNASLSSNQNPFSMQHLMQHTEKSVMLTGLTYPVLLVLIKYVTRICTSDKLKPTKLSLEDQILLTLVKLKHNMSFDLLSHVSGISKTTAIEYFWKWLDVMYIWLKFFVKMGERDNIFKMIPPVFKKKFPRLTSIIDCFEIFIEAPTSLLARAQCYSTYKKHCTIKVMISCTPLGTINFVSRCWGGRASDIQIVRDSQFFSSRYHLPGDQILADRGFTLVDDFAAGSGSELIIPAFTRGKNQLSAQEVENTRKITSVRIHIERVIGLLKNRYTILKGIMPIQTVKKISDENLNDTLASCDKMVTVCSALVNMNKSIAQKPEV